VGAYYSTPFIGSGSTSSGWASGHGRLSPLWLNAQVTLDRIGMFAGVNSNRRIRLGVYELDPATLFPTALAFDNAVFDGTLSQAFLEATINLTLDAGWWGLAFAMSGAGTSNSFAIQNTGNTWGPWGNSGPDGAVMVNRGALVVNGTTTQYTSAMPAPGDWVVETSNAAQTTSGVRVRRSA
jgi:hypothetical protein